MDIYINDEKINFELENEKNALEIITGIGEFATKSDPQQFITGIFIDSKEYSFADEKGLSKLLINQIKNIKVETTDIFGITILSINQIEKFLLLLTDIIEGSKWDNGYEKISESMDWMREGINQIVSIFGTEQNNLLNEKVAFYSAFEKLNKILFNLTKSAYPLDTETKNQAIEAKNSMKTNLSNIKNYLYSVNKIFDKEIILDNINKIIDEIEGIIPKLENVPILFQSGEDQESMEVIKKLTNILEHSIGVFVIFKENSKLHLDKFTVREVSFEEFFHILTDHLKELMTAIENKDSIMIGDLLEYEFVPNIEEIRNILVKIKNEAFVKAN